MSAILSGPAKSDGLGTCSNRELKKIVLAEKGPKDDRVREIKRQLLCLGERAAPLVAAAASYEVAMHLAGADGGSVDFADAALWAAKSADLASKAGDDDLAKKARFAAAQLEYYGASDLDQLRKAEASVRTARANCATLGESEFCAVSLKLLAEVQRDIAALVPQGRKRAIDTVRQFLATSVGRTKSLNRASALLDLGTLVASGTEDDVTLAEIDEVQHALEEASSSFRDAGDTARMRLADVNLGAFLVERGPNTDASLRHAEDLLRPLATDGRVDPALQSIARKNLGGLLIRKQSGNRQRNVAEAIELLRGAHAETPTDNVEMRCRTAYNLAMALAASGVAQSETFAEAESLLQSAAEEASKAKLRGLAAKTIWMLATIKLQLLNGGDFEIVDPRDRERLLDEVKALMEEADTLTDGVRGAESKAIASDYLLAISADRDSSLLDAAVREMRRAGESVDRNSRPALWATIRNNLGNLCNDSRRPDLWPCAAQAYGEALQVRTREDFPREHADTAVNLAALRFRQRDWAGAATLYAEVAKNSTDNFDISMGRSIARYDAARSDRWFERGAYALAQLGRTEEAVRLADEGRVRFLRRRLGALDSRGGGGLMEHLSRVISSETVRIIMPVTTSAGTVVFVIHKKEGRVLIGQLFLNNLSGDKVARFLNSTWLNKYQTHWGPAGNSASNASWNAVLVEVGDWLGSQLIVPILDRMRDEGIPPGRSLMLVLQGELAQLPIHLAKLSNGNHLLQEYRLAYLPSLAVLVSPKADNRMRKLISIADPTAAPDLEFAPLEGRVGMLSSGITLTGPATRAAVLDAIGRAEIFHFVGHARFDPEHPEESSLRLAGDDRLKVREIEDAGVVRLPGLVILSACETGRFETATMANEFVGMPAAFVGLGSRGVISSLWPARDGPTLFLMAHLLKDLSTGKDPASALRSSQLWLAQADGRELAQTLHMLNPEKGSKAARLEFMLRVQYANVRPFEAPWAWAGFQFTGVTVQ